MIRPLNVCFLIIKHNLHSVSLFPPIFRIHVSTQKGCKGAGMQRWNNGLVREEVILLSLTPQRTLLINWLFDCVLSFH